MYHAESIWWPGGEGYVVHRNRAVFRLAKALHDLTRRSSRQAHRARMLPYLKTYLQNTATFGEPPVAHDEALSLISKFGRELSEGMTAAPTVELDEEVEEHLKRMGYL